MASNGFLIEASDIEVRDYSGLWKPIAGTIAVKQGQRIALIGKSGSGKTALLTALSGFSGDPNVKGSVRLSGRAIEGVSDFERARKIAYVPSSPELFLSGVQETLYREIGFSLQVLGISPDGENARIEDFVGKFQLQKLVDRPPRNISGGELVLLVLASALVKSPKILLIDECLNSLDQVHRRIVDNIIGKYLQAGGSVVEAWNNFPEWSDSFDEVIFFRQTDIVRGSYKSLWPVAVNSDEALLPFVPRLAAILQKNGVCKFPTPPQTLQIVANSVHGQMPDQALVRIATKPHPREIYPALIVENLEFKYDKFPFVLGPVFIKANMGDIIALVGDNGAGKTTLLKCLGLLLRPSMSRLSVIDEKKMVFIDAPPPRNAHLWSRKVRYTFQDPDAQLFRPTVRAELLGGALKEEVPAREERANEAVNRLGLKDALDVLPTELPKPYRRLVTIASALATRPSVLLLDEPTEGLDGVQKRAVYDLILEFADHGGVVVFISHDWDLVSHCASKVAYVREGKIESYTDRIDFIPPNATKHLSKHWRLGEVWPKLKGIHSAESVANAIASVSKMS